MLTIIVSIPILGFWVLVLANYSTKKIPIWIWIVNGFLANLTAQSIVRLIIKAAQHST